MGIKNLNKFLREHFPEVIETNVHISNYSYKKIAIDISMYMYIFKARHANPDNPSKELIGWLTNFVTFVLMLRRNNIHCVFIYDAIDVHHPDKEKERLERRQIREKLDTKISSLDESMEHYDNYGEVNQVLLDFQKEKNLNRKQLIGNQSPFDSVNVKYHINQLKRQLIKITEYDFNLTKEMFNIMKIPYFTAPLEAETMCADLCKRGLVDAVLSRDSDVMVYSTPIFITDMNEMNGRCKQIMFANLLKELEFSEEQFLDFCIMCGTDYNTNVPNIGPNKAYAMIKQYKTIENIAEQKKLNIECLNHVRCREIFRNYETTNVEIPYCDFPDFNQLQEFLFRHNVKVDISMLSKSMGPNKIIFEE